MDPTLHSTPYPLLCSLGWPFSLPTQSMSIQKVPLWRVQGTYLELYEIVWHTRGGVQNSLLGTDKGFSRVIVYVYMYKIFHSFQFSIFSLIFTMKSRIYLFSWFNIHFSILDMQDYNHATDLIKRLKYCQVCV